MSPAMQHIITAVLVSTTILAHGLAQAVPPRLDTAITEHTKNILPNTLALYEWLHAHPELSEQEVQTAKRMADELRKLDMEVFENIGGTGVVGLMRNDPTNKKPWVLYRADMDALPIHENTGLAYASKKKGVMHACAHDIHMANAIGTLQVMHALREHWQGTIVFVAQPAEEVGRGARAMLQDPKFKKIIGRHKIAFALAVHNAADVGAGSVELVPGYARANVDSVDIAIYGKGGHGAAPHQAIDPVLIAAETVVSLQSIVSRRLDPLEPAVITVGHIEAGSKHNIIPPHALLQLTVRSYSAETRQKLFDEIKRTATHIALAHGAPKEPRVTIRDEHTPAAYNDPEAVERLRKLYSRLLGPKNVLEGKPSLTGEDFGRFPTALDCPGVLVRLGAAPRKRGKNAPGLHSDRWAPKASKALETGVYLMTHSLLASLEMSQ